MIQSKTQKFIDSVLQFVESTHSISSQEQREGQKKGKHRAKTFMAQSQIILCEIFFMYRCLTKQRHCVAATTSKISKAHHYK